ncbi:hypothetical protein [Algibacter mikhailovii]|uniref:hypothetical protein n=1 Tax=Algibacter mikhailovii TaxID=425498 RepID=UPI0024949FC6|nr:hypothetical protein [Algibacter mikhailovii]
MADELPFEIFIRETERLFETAKLKDEFEYVCALINFNGMVDPRALSHIHESRDLFFQMVELIEKSNNSHEQIRLLLLLYCHIFEMDEFYNIIGNMLRISLGERYGVMLYNSPTLTKELKPANKLDKLKSLAKKAGFELKIDGMTKRVVSLRDYILPLTQSTVNIAGHFFNLLRSSRLDYKENKIVIGRLEPKGVKIEIKGHPERGLSGFQTVIE